MKIQKKIKKVEREIVVSAARYLEQDTGRKQIIEIVDEKGKSKKEERPITERVFVEAKKEIKQEDKTVFEVDDGVDVHEFAEQKDAEQFTGSIK